MTMTGHTPSSVEFCWGLRPRKAQFRVCDRRTNLMLEQFTKTEIADQYFSGVYRFYFATFAVLSLRNQEFRQTLRIVLYQQYDK
jgi:hypothetical protein